MGIFGRRVVQRALDDITPVIPNPSDRKDLVQRLNGKSRTAITAEWEVVMTRAISSVAAIKYQLRHKGKSRPDLLVVGDLDGEPFEFLAEIVAPSDETSTKNNPAGFFFDEFSRISAKTCGYSGGFNIKIGDTFIGKFPHRRRELLLPPKGQIPSFIASEFKELFSHIKKTPTGSYAHHCRTQGIDVFISFNPGKRNSNSGQFGVCSAPYSLEGNPLFFSLNEKASQLHKSLFEGIKGIIVVDGGCNALSSTNVSGGNPWSCHQIVEHFLQKHPYIDFVTLTSCHSGPSHPFEYKFRHRIYWKRPFEDEKIKILYPVLASALSALPAPRQDPRNAWLRLRAGRDISAGWSLGASIWTPRRRLGFSARTFLALVAGTLTEKQLLLSLNDSMPNRGALFEFFRDVSEFGREIRDAWIAPAPDEDDDQIFFHLLKESESIPRNESDELPFSVGIPVGMLVQFIARLAYELLLEEKQPFSLGAVPSHIREPLQIWSREGRMLVGARLEQDRKVLRLTLGDRDAAVCAYS